MHWHQQQQSSRSSGWNVVCQGCTCEVVLGLANIHPVAREGEGIQLAIAADEGEGLLLDGGGPHLDAVQHCWAQAVDACVDLVTHKHLHKCYIYQCWLQS